MDDLAVGEMQGGLRVVNSCKTFYEHQEERAVLHAALSGDKSGDGIN